MNRSLAITVVAVLILVLGAVLFASFTKKKESPTPPARAPVQAVVEITKDGFNPATLTVKKGTKVVWINKDEAEHRVASNPYPTHTGLPGLDSKKNITQGESYSYTFDKGGLFGYHDHLNPVKFKGTVIVE